MVEFKLLFKEKVTDETAVAPLKKAVDNGNLGPLAVNPASLRIVKEDEGNLRTFSTRNISSSSNSRISNRGSAGTGTSSDNGSRNIIKYMGSGRRSSISSSSSSGGNRCNSDISAVVVVAALAVVVARVVTLAMGVESRSSSGSGSGVLLAAARAVTMAVVGVRVVRVPAAPEVTIA